MDILIETAERCNANCQFCARRVAYSESCAPDMTLEEAIEAMKFGIKWGGKPLCA